MNQLNQLSPIDQIQKRADDKMDTMTILLIFLMAFLQSVFHLSLLVLFVRRLKQIFKIRIFPFYYLVVLVYIIGKMIVLGLLQSLILQGISNQFVDVKPDSIEKYFKLAIIIADFALVQMFLLSFEAYMVLCYKILAMKNFKKLFKFCTRIIGFFILIIQIAIMVLFSTDVFNYDVINTINAIFNFLSIVTFLISFFYLNFNMTGLMIDAQMNETMKQIYGVILCLLLSRFLSTSFQMLILVEINDGTFMGFIGTIQENQGKYITYGLCFICYFVFILITEGAPMMMSLRANIVGAFNKQFKHEQDQNVRQSIITSNSEINENLLDNPSDLDQMELIVEFKAFRIIETLPSTTTMWNTMKASIGERVYILRQIKGQVSNYIIEDIMNEIQEVKQLNIKPLNKVGFFTEQGSIYLYERFRPIDFDQMLQRCKTLIDQLKLALKIALAIQKFHMKQVAHGCIKPSNIHFDLTENVYFLGYGMQTLKKYFSLTTDYTNKSFCTAIQSLKDRNTIILKQKKSSDIYSFSMILYEIVTKNKDYREMQLQQVKQKFAEEHFRPKIPDNIDGNIKNLMRKCWQADPSQRPYIGYVIDVLRRLLP